MKRWTLLLLLSAVSLAGCVKQVAEYQNRVEEERVRQKRQKEAANFRVDHPEEAADGDIKIIGLGLDFYREDNGDYPTTEQGLKALVTKPTSPPIPKKWKGPYLKDGVPKDPWGQDYIYVSPGDHNIDYDLSSKAGSESPEDDITNRLK